MKIFLTGSSGFLGKIIISTLAGENIISIEKLNESNKSDVYFKIPRISRFDIFIHAAGKAHSVPKNYLENRAFFDVNVIGTKNLLQSLFDSNSIPKSFIFISSVAVYGRNNGINISESAPLLAADSYGLSKIQAEQVVIDWCLSNDVICTILRLPLLVGLNPPGNLGEMIKGIKKGYYFNISGGNARKSMVMASDVSLFILKISEIGGVYNLTDGYHPTFNELSYLIAKQIGRKYILNIPFIFCKFIAVIGDLIGHGFPLNSNKLSKMIATLTYDDSKARRTVGWNPNFVLKEFKISNNV